MHYNISFSNIMMNSHGFLIIHMSFNYFITKFYRVIKVINFSSIFACKKIVCFMVDVTKGPQVSKGSLRELLNRSRRLVSDIWHVDVEIIPDFSDN